MKKGTLIVLGLSGAGGVALVMVALIAAIVVSVAKPVVPIEVLYRESYVGEGYVAQIKNKTSKHVVVKAHFSNRTLKQSFQTSIDLPPKATREIGWIKGWKLRSGDDMMFSMVDHRNFSARIP
ncbi:MAG: hypothetical protein KIT88_01170 [Phycisphaeraceae bacterium]|nr:hypothetical protein [Phycisphaeraceae bacterium]